MTKPTIDTTEWSNLIRQGMNEENAADIAMVEIASTLIENEMLDEANSYLNRCHTQKTARMKRWSVWHACRFARDYINFTETLPGEPARFQY